MTLLDRCENLRKRIVQHDSLRLAHKEAEGFRHRSSALEDVRSALASQVGRLHVLREKGVAIAKMPDPESTVAVLQEYRQKLSEGSSDSGRDYARLKRSIDKIEKDVTITVEKALDLVRRDLPTIEEAFLKQVELIPAYTSQVARIRTERDRLLAGTEPSAMTPVELEQFLDRRDELRTLADKLDPSEFPKEVLDFFRAARHGGAPLEKFTEEVRTWLRERDQLKNIRVSVLGR